MNAARARRPATEGAFARRVLQTVSRIPSGRVTTYGDVARLAGRPRAARAVGRILAAAGRPGLPYHRVIAAGGAVGGYGSAIEMKAALLRAEGTLGFGLRGLDGAGRRWPR